MKRIRSWMVRTRHWLKTGAADNAIRVAVVLSIALSLFSNFYVNKLQTCQTNYSLTNAAALRARDVAAQTDRKAWDDMVGAVLSATTREESRGALESYVATRARADALRAQNPLPVPERFC